MWVCGRGERRGLAGGRGGRGGAGGAAARVTFRAALTKYEGMGGWFFVAVPSPPKPTHPWGRAPVWATVDGYRWATSVWCGKEGAVLAVPKRARGGKGVGEEVSVEITPRVGE